MNETLYQTASINFLNALNNTKTGAYLKKTIYHEGYNYVVEYGNNTLINQLVGKITPKYFIEKNLKEVYFDTEKITDSLIERYHDLTLRVGNRAAFIAKANQPMIDHTARLKLITTPTLILWGRNDHWISVAHATRFSKDLPHSKVEIMEETGHVPMEERPFESVAHTLQFLNRQ